MDTTWVVVANAGRARIFSREGANGALDEIDAMVNAAVRLRAAETETETDRLGPTSAGKSIHNTGGALPTKAYEPPQTPTEHETELFARSIVAALLLGLQKGGFQRLALIASPQFLGVLRQMLVSRVGSSLPINVPRSPRGKEQKRSKAGALRAFLTRHRGDSRDIYATNF